MMANLNLHNVKDIEMEYENHDNFCVIKIVVIDNKNEKMTIYTYHDPVDGFRIIDNHSIKEGWKPEDE